MNLNHVIPSGFEKALIYIYNQHTPSGLRITFHASRIMP